MDRLEPFDIEKLHKITKKMNKHYAKFTDAFNELQDLLAEYADEMDAAKFLGDLMKDEYFVKELAKDMEELEEEDLKHHLYHDDLECCGKIHKKGLSEEDCCGNLKKKKGKKKDKAHKLEKLHKNEKSFKDELHKEKLYKKHKKNKKYKKEGVEVEGFPKNPWFK